MDIDLSNLVITKVYGAHRIINSRKGIISKRLLRERWAFALKVQGHTVYKFKQSTIHSDALHPVLLPKGSSYDWECLEEGVCYIIEFDSPITYESPIPLYVSENSLIKKSFLRIEQNLATHSPFCELEAIKECYNILLFSFSTEQQSYNPKQKKQLLQPALDYIAKYYNTTKITNDMLADYCNMSTVHFRKSFRNAFGISAINYLQNLRMEKAKAMLESDFDSITQIAESVGYNSIYHFSKMFKQHFGVSPSNLIKGYFTEDIASKT